MGVLYKNAAIFIEGYEWGPGVPLVIFELSGEAKRPVRTGSCVSTDGKERKILRLYLSDAQGNPVSDAKQSSRYVAAEFTFFLAIPVMFGASALKMVIFGFHYTGEEILVLVVGMVTAFIVSILSIKFLLRYIKNNDFKAFGWYRIALGLVVLAYLFLVGDPTADN